MADERPEDTDSARDSGRPKRPPPTLDLTATELTGRAGTEVTGRAGTDVTGEAGTEFSNGTAAPGASAGTAEPGVEAAGAATAADATPPNPPPRPARTAATLVSAFAGAVAAGLVLAVVWFLGWPGQTVAPAAPPVDTAAVDALAGRLTRLESKSAIPPAVPDPTALTRIDALEKTIAGLREELNASRGRAERLNAAVNELKAAPRDAAPAAPDLSAINEKLVEIERATRAQIAEAAQRSAKPADDKPLRRVVAATLLELSVRLGEPFSVALATAKTLAPDPGVLAPLEPFAAAGVPNPNALSRELLATLMPKPAPAAESTATTGTGIVDRLQAGAARLIHLQRIDAADATDRSAAVVRAAAAVQRNDVAGARRELNTLTGAERDAVQPGIARLDARDAALAASHQFATDALTALAKSAP